MKLWPLITGDNTGVEVGWETFWVHREPQKCSFFWRGRDNGFRRLTWEITCLQITQVRNCDAVSSSDFLAWELGVSNTYPKWLRKAQKILL